MNIRFPYVGVIQKNDVQIEPVAALPSNALPGPQTHREHLERKGVQRDVILHDARPEKLGQHGRHFFAGGRLADASNTLKGD
jgi:hypothetical protein